jgi:squalene synthase HpnC
LALLDWLEDDLNRSAQGTARHPLLRQLSPTLVQCHLPLTPFRSLIEANRRDQGAVRYRDFEELLSYCQFSAAPVGRLVLLVFDQSTPVRQSLSDDVCNGLQLVEHLQDVGEDWGKGRVYLPQSDLVRFGCSESDLARPSASPALRALLRHEAGRARRLLGSVTPLVHGMPWRPRMAIGGFAAGGLAAIDAMAAADFDVLGRTCRPARRRVLTHLVTGGRARESRRFG